MNRKKVIPSIKVKIPDKRIKKPIVSSFLVFIINSPSCFHVSSHFTIRISIRACREVKEKPFMRLCTHKFPFSQVTTINLNFLLLFLSPHHRLAGRQLALLLLPHALAAVRRGRMKAFNIIHGD